MQEKEVNVIKAGGHTEAFNPLKLENSLLKAGATSEMAEEIIAHIEKELIDGMSTSRIYNHAFFLLGKIQRPAAVRYSLRRAVLELGPSGFPFEDFVAQILKEKGFETLTGQIVMGSCVEHEMDIIAWNENKLIMAEAKFHNLLGIKSDLKVALYVKARFDDLKGVKYMYGTERFLDEGWLITNTKFTTTAIHYGECQNLKLIGWNYPEVGNLQDMMQDSGLHPITCLTSLSSTQKHTLLKQEIVMCKTIKENPDVLRSLGFNSAKIERILEEIHFL